MNKIILSVCTLVLSVSLNAQTNFSGTWFFKSKEHLLGPEYANALASKMNVSQKTDSVIIENTSVSGNGGETKTRSAFAVNGKSSSVISETTKRKYTRTLSWSKDKKSMVLTTIFFEPENENEIDFTRVETWFLSPDGKTLNIHKKSIETRSETWEVKGTYQKQ